MITITHDGHTYESILSREPDPHSPVTIKIYRDDVWAGTGILSTRYQIENCAADLGEPVYEALEGEIEEVFARGVLAEFDPAV